MGTIRLCYGLGKINHWRYLT